MVGTRPSAEIWLPTRRGALATLMRTFDWSGTDVGPPESWPLSLRSYVAMILEMPTPAIVFWGPNHTQLYNDGYATIMGPRHPKYLGARYETCWPETYPLIHPWMQQVLEQGDVIQVEDELVVLTRHGFSEEAYFTFTFSPLRDDTGAIAGIFQPVVETTDSVLARRRMETLRQLASLVDSPEAVARGAMEVLSRGARDIPFAVVYLFSDASQELELSAHFGFEGLDVPEWHLRHFDSLARHAFATRSEASIEDVSESLGSAHVGPWPEPTQRAQIMPLMRSATDSPRGVAIFGVSPRLHFDAPYQEFLGRIARELAAIRAAEQAKAMERNLLAREKSAREEAELQKELLTELIRQAPTPMAVLRGPAFVVELANAEVCRVWMRHEQDITGKPLFDALPEVRSQAFGELLCSVYNTGQPFVGSEVLARIQALNGTLTDLYFNFVYAPLRATSGEVDGILVIAVDVTEQVHAREQVERLKTDAEAASRAKDEFLALLGHELRNPLAPILTALELMELRGVPGVKREREVIERQAQHLVRLVDDLLDISRIISGKVRLKKKELSLKDVITRGVEMALPMLEARKHDLVLDIDPNMIAVRADLSRLSQAVTNLLTNAAKYTEPGGRITVRTGRSNGGAWLSVADTGIGIEPDRLPRIFEAFVQEKQDLDRSQGGLGLGLAIVRGIVQLHGGRVEARSPGRGHGSEFYVWLPDHEPNRCASSGEASKHVLSSATRKTHILLVDDNRDASDSLGAALDLLGHRISIAYDGPSALLLARDDPPDIAILDIGLPVMDGYELAERLHDVPMLRSLPLVALTGYGQDTDRARSRAAGFSAHLVKPVDLNELHDLLLSLTIRTSSAS